MLTGLITTFFCTPETKGLTLEELSQEDQDNFVRGSNVGVRGSADSAETA